MITMRVIRKTTLKNVPLKLDGDVLDKIGKVVAGSILDNIRSQQTVDGGQLKANAPSTRAAKRAMGLPPLSLVFKQHRFVKGNSASWAHAVDAGDGRVTIRPANQELANISRSLQQRGYVGFFGISLRAREAVRAAVRKWIRERFRAMRARQ
jgi:hypothetical protein